MTAIQGERHRIRQALIDLCFERGFPALTLEELCGHAQLDRSDFERHFADLEDCFCQVYEAELEDFLAQATRVRESHSAWRDRLRAVAYTLFRVLDQDPKVTNLVIAEVRSAGPRAQLSLERGVKWLIDLVDEGRQEADEPERLSRGTAESVAGGIFSQLFNAAASHGPLPSEGDVVPQMMYSAVLPYLGHETALEELEIPPPAQS